MSKKSSGFYDFESDPDYASRDGGKTWARVKPITDKSARRGCAGCAKRREALAAAKKAYDEGRPFTMKERIAAARKAFEAKLAEKNGS